MVNINPNRESCMEYMKELIRQKLPREEVSTPPGYAKFGENSHRYLDAPTEIKF